MARELSMVQVDKKVHAELKKYCKDKGLMIGPFIDKLASDFMNNRVENEMREYNSRKLKLQEETIEMLKRLENDLSSN